MRGAPPRPPESGPELAELSRRPILLGNNELCSVTQSWTSSLAENPPGLIRSDRSLESPGHTSNYF